MKANNGQLNLSDDRRKEYHRQQEKLKAMANVADKVKSVSADAMIENLLKSSFKKPMQTPNSTEKQDSVHSELPSWLQCGSPVVPSQYKHLWSLVQSTPELADTQKVSQLLLTSGLHVDVLGFIWSMVNKAVPGQLTKQEFFIMLSLVGLAQTGCSFSSLSVLKILPGPSVPVLQTSVLINQVPPRPKASDSNDLDFFQDFQSFSSQQSMPSANINGSDNQRDQILRNSAVNVTNFLHPSPIESDKEKTEVDLIHGNICSKPNKLNEIPEPELIKGPYQSSNFPCIGSSPTEEIDDDFSDFQSVPAEKTVCEKFNSLSCDSSDDFSDFQSANVESLDPFETVVITQKREIPKITLPKSFTGKLSTLKSNILKISPESERKLKVLTQPESLSSLPESKISSNNKVSTSISVLGSNHGIGSRLANHSLSAKLERTKHHKHHRTKINLNPIPQPDAEEDIILGVRRTNVENLMPKCCSKKPPNCKTFILKETKIRSDDAPESVVIEQLGNDLSSAVLSGENTRQIEIPMLGTFNETVLPSQTSGVDLISVQEDKYSALREIEIELNQSTAQKSSELEGNDEFGDFLSADIPAPPPPPLPSQTLPIPNPSNPSISEFPSDPLNEKQENDTWGDWSFNTETTTLSVDAAAKPEEPFVEIDPFDSFNLVSLSNNEDQKQLEEQLPPVPHIDIFNSIETNSILEPSNTLTKDTLDPLTVFDGEENHKTTTPTIQTKTEQSINNQSDTEFWDFLTSDVKAPADVTLSRHGSLPSLDFKMSTSEETEQEVVWRKCLDSCHNLIQEGFEIFNNINVKSVLDEVFATPKTSEYLNYLNITYQIAKRVSQNYNDFSIHEDLERIWRRLEELCFEYNIKLKQNEDNVQEGKVQCSICLGYIGVDLIKQGPSCYHPSCANLWINFVEATLPYST